MSDRRVVYSTDPNQKVEGKKAAKKPEKPVKAQEHCIKLRLETKARGGKAVSVLYDLPENKVYLKKLLKELKGKCACGGSLKEDGAYTLEIQGDHRSLIKEVLLKKGFQVKGA